jgi:hypothetical protein
VAAVTPLLVNEHDKHTAAVGWRTTSRRFCWVSQARHDGHSVLHSKRCNTIMTPRRSRLLLTDTRPCCKRLWRSAILTADGIRAMPSARALLVASLLTEPPYGCLGPPGNDRYRKRSLHSKSWATSQVNCQRRGGFLQWIRHQPMCSARRYRMIHLSDPSCILRNRREHREAVGLEFDPSETATKEGRIKDASCLPSIG